MPKHLPLTAARIKSTKASDHDVWLSDDHGVRGSGRLVLRVTPGNLRRFYFRPPRRSGIPSALIPLGAYSHKGKEGYLTLQEARHKADGLARGFVVPGFGLGDPFAATIALPPEPLQGLPLPVVRQFPATPSDEVGLSLAELCRNYVARLKAEAKQSARDVENEFKRFVYRQSIGEKPARELDTEAFTNLLREVRKSTTKYVANKLRGYLHTAYANAMQAATDFEADDSEVDRGIKSNPLASIKAKPRHARERALNRDELRELWARLSPAAGVADLSPEMRAVRLSILLAGQRGQQLLRVTTADIDLEAETILLLDPKGRRALPRPHLLPLGPLAKAEIHLLLKHSQSMNSRALFASAQSGKVLSSSTVSKLVAQISRQMVDDQKAHSPFQYLDLRRTIETTLAALDVHKDVRAQLQSHGLSGVQEKHYDKHDYLPQKREALLNWEAFLMGLLVDSPNRR